MIPSIDYLTLVLAGIALFYVGVDAMTDQPEGTIWDLLGLLCAGLGTILFCLGAVRAFMSAVGLG